MELRYRQGDYLYHGSPYKFDVVRVRQAVDVMFEEGCQNAVYASESIDMAICFALGVEGSADGERIMMPDDGMKMRFVNCHPRYGKKGYIYVLNKSSFVHVMGTQWVSHEDQEPVDILEISVNDYIDSHCIIE